MSIPRTRPGLVGSTSQHVPGAATLGSLQDHPPFRYNCKFRRPPSPSGLVIPWKDSRIPHCSHVYGLFGERTRIQPREEAPRVVSRESHGQSLQPSCPKGRPHRQSLLGLSHGDLVTAPVAYHIPPPPLTPGIPVGRGDLAGQGPRSTNILTR